MKNKLIRRSFGLFVSLIFTLGGIYFIKNSDENLDFISVQIASIFIFIGLISLFIWIVEFVKNYIRK